MDLADAEQSNGPDSSCREGNKRDVLGTYFHGILQTEARLRNVGK